jgi:serine/threonine-protein kinase
MGQKPAEPLISEVKEPSSRNDAFSSAPTFVASSLTSALSPNTPTSTILTRPKRCPKCDARYPKEFRVCPQDAEVLEEATEQDPLIGAILANTYHIVQLIGEGGMGRVYEARHMRLANKRLAVKMLHEDMARQPEILTRFEREAEAASTIAHPNVVEVLDVDHLDDGRPYIICEYLDGEEFGALLDRVGKLPTETAIRITRQICRALVAAHERGIVHRDMKPENVFLVGDQRAPRVKVIDFGISKQNDGSSKLTRTGMVMGTPAYMAPEQARGEHVDFRADIYAVGSILYRAVTGHKPYDGEDGAMVLTQVLTEDPKRPRAVDSTVPEALELLIQRAMARDPAERHASMAELEAELAELDPGAATVDGTLPSIMPPTFATVKPTEQVLVSRAKPAQTQQALRAQREVRSARPLLVVVTLVGYLWLIAAISTAAADALRWSRGYSGQLTNSEAVLISLIAFVATITPAGIWVRHLEKAVWRNTVTAVAFSKRARVSLAIALSTQGVLTLAVNLVEALLLRAPAGHLQLAFSAPSIGASVIAAVGTFFLLGRKRDKKTN